MLRLHLSCGQGVPTPFGRCICIALHKFAALWAQWAPRPKHMVN